MNPKTTTELKDLWKGQSEALLKELHILTRDGHLNQDSRRKLKQVRHLYQLLEPELNQEFEDGKLLRIADLGAGKSYLGFILYDLWMRSKENTSLWAIESRTDLVEKTRTLAKLCKFDRIHAVPSTILEAQAGSSSDALPEQIEVVTALHACDTATDEAIAFGIRKSAKVIALVPCCQAEVSRLLEDLVANSQNITNKKISHLWRHAIHRREFGSHLTNVIRGLVLESRGYRVRVTELTGWEHSMKNELILARKVQNANAKAASELAALLETFPIPMKLLEMV
jgi:Methyltransferase domain